MWSKCIKAICLLTIFVNIGDAAKILGISHVPGKSHYMLVSAYMRGLAEAGHDVTVISYFGEKNPPKNGRYRDIVLPDFTADKKKVMGNESAFDVFSQGPYLQALFIIHMSADITENFLNATAIQDLMKSGEKFDVVVVEEFLNDAMKAFANHFNGHLITFSSVAANTWINPLVANPAPSSYVPELVLSYPPKMTFLQRVNNVVYNMYYSALTHLMYYPKQRALVQKYFPNGPSFDEILYNSSIVLLNGHESLNHAMPHVPIMVNIGGFHVSKPKKLPDDLQKFMDEAKDGVVYFSLGSNLQSDELPAETRDAILRVFSKLKQKVLWKWEADVLPGQPSNVKLGKWLPQQDILAHPNIKVFITHGGLLSTTETVYHGVPVVAIPVYGDQHLNAKTAENAGYGLVMPYKEFSEQTLERLLNEILNNPKYGENAKLRSKILHDRPSNPIDTAVYWTEYVIRHNGAPHLRVAGVHLPWYQYYLIDVFAVLLGVALSIVYILKKLVCLLCAWMNRKKSVKVKKN